MAVNKIDRENADVDKAIANVAEHNLVPEEWGGETIFQRISALQNTGIDELLDQILLVSEVEELRASPEGRAVGVVLEANLDIGRGPVATVLVQNGTLRVGDPMVAGAAWGRVRALINDRGEQVKEAGPSTPVRSSASPRSPTPVGSSSSRRMRRWPAGWPTPVSTGSVSPRSAAKRTPCRRRQARGHLRPDPARRGGHAQPDHQGRRQWFARSPHRVAPQAGA